MSRVSQSIVFIVTLAAATGGEAQQSSAPPPPPPYSDDLVAKGKASDPSESYARDFGVSAAIAKDRLALQ